MLETVIFFTVVSILTEIILMLQLPLWLRRSKWFTAIAVAITVAVTILNFWVGFGTVTGTLTAKLAFLGGFAATPFVRWVSGESNSISLRTRAWLATRGATC